MLAAFALLLMPGDTQGKRPECRIYITGGQEIEEKEMAGLINSYDVILFGEYHDNAVLHQLEAALLKNAFLEQPKLAVSLEMFERDVQNDLEEYLAGRSTEQEFLSMSRPWKNYDPDYRPLVEFARMNALPVIAANIPRPVAAQYARTGSLAGIADKDAVYLPRVQLAPQGEYRERFMSYMAANRGPAMPVSDEQLENYYKAQCLKDDTMAESIIAFHRLRPDYKVIHYQGDFHSRYRLGVAEKLRMLDPALKVAVVAPVYVKGFDGLQKLFKEQQKAGDIIVFLQQKSS